MTSSQCKALSAALGSRVSYRTDSAFMLSLESYWSQQEGQLIPNCIVSPNSAQEVAVTINILSSASAVSKTEVSFALRGGGHNPTAGSANIHQGVTIDLRSINGVNVSLDKTVTSIGGGAVWRDVYLKLEAMGLMIAGGRGSNVGVGGLTLGGERFISSRMQLKADSLNRWHFILFPKKRLCLRQRNELSGGASQRPYS